MTDAETLSLRDAETVHDKDYESLSDKSSLRKLLVNLPMLPEVAARMLTLDGESETYYEEILALASQDPFIAAKTILIANSAANAGRSKITSIQQAVARIGTNQVKALTTTIALSKAFKPTGDEQKKLWLHAIQTAIYAQQLARLNKQDPEAAYLAGLLHNIGRIILLKQASAQGAPTLTHSWEELLQNDNKIFGFSHNELGVEACKMWNIPDMIYGSIHLMHTSSREVPPYTKPTETQNLSFLLKVSSALSLLTLSETDSLEDEAEISRLAAPAVAEGKQNGIFVTTSWVGKNAHAISEKTKEMGSTLGL